MRLQRRVVTYEDFDISANELLSLREAADMLGIQLPGIAGLIDRGTLTEIRDADAIERKRRYTTRFVLREEVETLIARRQTDA